MKYEKARFCYWCGCSLNNSPFSDRQKTREHLLPRSLGGTRVRDNIVAACAKCNRKRGNSMMWRAYQWRRRTRGKAGTLGAADA